MNNKNSEVYGIIYKITNKINGKVYIGQTTRTLEKRLSDHIRNKKSLISKAINKYRIEKFIIEIIDRANTTEELNNKEKYWIKFYNCISPKGYNLCEGGGQTNGYHHTEEAKIKMSNFKKSCYNGEANPFYGKTHSDEIKKLFSKQRKGRKLNENWIKNLIKSHGIKVINLDTKIIFDSIKEAGTFYNIEPTHITRVCKGKRKRTGGYHWMYYEDYIKQQEQIHKENIYNEAS